MKKILVLSNAYPSRQKKYSAIFVKNQFEWLVEKSSFDVSIFFIERKFTTILGSVKKYIISYIRFIKLIKKKFDCIHIHFLSPMILLPYIYKGFHPDTKIIMTMHGSDIYKLESSLLQRIYQRLIKRIDIIICVGEAMKDEVDSKLGRNVDFVLSAGINNKLIKPSGKGFTERDIDILYVGSFYQIKGIDRVVDTIMNINDVNLKIVFIGSGNYYSSELQRLKDHVDLRIINGLKQEELNCYYNRSKFLIMPSRSEGFGLTLAEALYCGTPVIASDLKQFKYLIQPNKNGFVFKGDNIHELEGILRYAKTISENEWNKLSKNSAESVSEHTLDNVCEKLIQIYNPMSR